MPIRPLLLVLTCAILSGPLPASAQRSLLEGAAGPRIDPLTGEPFRPRSAHPHTDPEIVNAPHAPLQRPRRSDDDPPVEIYVVPQIGGGTSALPPFNGRR